MGIGTADQDLLELGRCSQSFSGRTFSDTHSFSLDSTSFCVAVGHMDNEWHCPILSTDAVQEPCLCHTHTGQPWGYDFAVVLLSDCGLSRVQDSDKLL